MTRLSQNGNRTQAPDRAEHAGQTGLKPAPCTAGGKTAADELHGHLFAQTRPRSLGSSPAHSGTGSGTRGLRGPSQSGHLCSKSTTIQAEAKTERGRRTLNLSSGLRRKNGRRDHGWRPGPGDDGHRAPAAAYGAHCGNAAAQGRWQRRGSTVTSPSHHPRLRPEQAAGGEHVPLSLRTE